MENKRQKLITLKGVTFDWHEVISFEVRDLSILFETKDRPALMIHFNNEAELKDGLAHLAHNLLDPNYPGVERRK